MQAPDYAPDELGPDWDEDTIYCAAIAQPGDVLYEGSEDEDYTSPTVRRAKYEAAGRTFLRGRVPLLLSATLRGPFEADSGWANPWRSKYRTAKSLDPNTAPAGTTQESQRADIPDTLDCHLPSPESLKQAALTEQHRYLEDDELALVHSWREAVRPGPARDDFWTSRPETMASTKRRRTEESGWLKVPVCKRTRTDIVGTAQITSPSRKRRRSSRLTPKKRPALGPNVSFGSAPGRLLSANRPPSAQGRIHGPASDRGRKDAEDELMEDTAFVSFSSAPRRVSTTPKRVSPRRSVRRPSTGKLEAMESEDELSRDKAAAATLSSPVSKEGATPKLHKLRSSQPTQSSGRAMTTRSRSELSPPKSRQFVDTHIASEEQPHVVIGKADEAEGDVSAYLETQRDDSFCYKKRSKIKAAERHVETVTPGVAAQSPGSTLSTESGSWSGLSDDDDTNPQETTKNTSPASAAEKWLDLGGSDINSEIKVEGSSPTNERATSGGSVKGVTLASVSNHGDQKLIDPETHDSSAIAPMGDVHEAETEECGGMLHKKPATCHQDVVNATVELEGEITEADDAMKLTTPCPEQPDIRAVLPMIDENLTVDIEEHSSLSTSGTLRTQVSSQGRQDTQTGESPSHDLEDSNSIAAAIPTIPALSDVTATKQATPSIANDASISKTRPSDLKYSVPNDFSLKSMLHRLVPSKSWARLSLSGPKVSQTPQADAYADGFIKTSEQSIGDITMTEVNEPLTHAAVADAECGAMSQAEKEAPLNMNEVTTGCPPTFDYNTTTMELDISTSEQAVDEADVLPTLLQPVSVSQQSPWAKSQLSQLANITSSALTVASTSVGTPQKACGDVSNMSFPAVQTPWATQVDHLPPMGSLDGTTSGLKLTPALPVRPSTPEPQFTVKSFASFMSPSPQRRARKLPWGRFGGSGACIPTSGGVWSSAMKSYDDPRSDRRVSWAPLPGEVDEVSESEEEQALKRARPASPPPKAPIAELPTSTDSKFHNHFTTMANRKSGLNRGILPTSSQLSPNSPMPLAMAEKFLITDRMRLSPLQAMDIDEPRVEEQLDAPYMAGVEPLETQDLVQEVFDDMAEFLEGFNVDAELDEARKGNGILV